MQIHVASIFPEMFSALVDYGVSGRAIRNKLVDLQIADLRKFGLGEHQVLDDRPFGGGPGMVMMAEPIVRCITHIRSKLPSDTPVVYLSPQGTRLEHADVVRFSKISELIILCGRYEGVDQRALDIIGAEEWSIGDYVLTGGELAAMVLIDAIARQIQGVLGNEQSSCFESFTNGLLDYVHYTRPQVFEGHEIPQVLVSGNHEAIRWWRLKQSLGKTWQTRPDLLEKLNLNNEQKEALEEFLRENRNMENL